MKATLFADIRKDNPTTDSVHIDNAGGSGEEPADPSKKKKPKNPSDWSTQFKIDKIDAEQRLVFGWASVVQKGDQIIIDKQGDIIPIEELEKAAYNFVLYSRENDDMHVGESTGSCVESMVFTAEKAAKGIVAKNAQGEQILGWFVGFRIENDALWKAHKEGRRPEFSIAGISQRIPV